jgi:outer membrane protein OmpA-like peptidoglycan-associated protein
MIMRIVFDFGSAKIRNGEVEALDRLVGILQERPLRVEVMGHASAAGVSFRLHAVPPAAVTILPP